MTSVIHVGHIDLSFHDASALEVEAILKKHGHVIERSAAPHEEMFQRMAHGEVDILVSAWLPASHGKYLEPFKDEVHEITEITVLLRAILHLGSARLRSSGRKRACRIFCVNLPWTIWKGSFRE